MTRLIPVTALVHHPDNPPGRLDDLDELVSAIKARGLLQALLVEPYGPSGQFIVIEGNRRLAASKRVGLTALPCTLRSARTRRDHVRDRLVANGHRENLTPMEQARGFAEMASEGLTQADIAAETVSARLALLHLAVPSQQLVESGRLRADDALKAVRSARGTSRPPTGAAGKTPASERHFGWNHPLAAAAAERCRTNHPKLRLADRIGAGACGPCWEASIRADEQRLAEGGVALPAC